MSYAAPNFLSPILVQPMVIVPLVGYSTLQRSREDGHNHANGNFPDEGTLELSFDGWIGVSWADMEGHGILKRRTSEQRCVGAFQNVGRIAWGGWFGRWARGGRPGPDHEGSYTQMNVNFLLKVTGMHWRVLSSEVAWLVLHCRHIA